MAVAENVLCDEFIDGQGFGLAFGQPRSAIDENVCFPDQFEYGSGYEMLSRHLLRAITGAVQVATGFEKPVAADGGIGRAIFL